jgi:hypothetical protein
VTTIYKDDFYRAGYYSHEEVVWIRDRFESGKILKIFIIKSNNFN